MTRDTGDQVGAGDDDAYLIPLRSAHSSAATTGPETIRVSSATAPTAAAPPGSGGPAAPLSRRKAVAITLLVTLAVGAFVGWDRGVEWWGERHDAQAYERYRSASVEIQPVMADYALPEFVDDPRSGVECGMGNEWCGSTALDPEDAVAAVASALDPRGVSVRSTDCTRRGSAGVDCVALLMFRGADIGSIRTARGDVTFRVFGQPTQVTVRIADAEAPYDFSQGQPVPATPMKDSQLAAAALPPAVAAGLRCTEVVPTGCLVYSATLTLDTSADEVWRDTGRRLVAEGWPNVSGFCAPTGSGPCNVGARKPSNANDRVGVSVTLLRVGERTKVTAKVSALTGFTG